MSGFTLAFNVVEPLVIYMAIGVLARRLKIMGEETLKEVNTFIFKVLISLQLFFDIYYADLSSALDPKLFILTGALITLAFVTAFVLCKRAIPDRSDAATVAQGIYRSNYVLFGTVISSSLAGESGLAVTAALSIVVVPLLNILAVIDFEASRGGKINIKRTLLQIVKNPLVLAGLLGAAVNASGLRIPELIAEPLNTIGDVASPLALVVLGGMLSVKSIVSHRGQLIAAIVGKLVIVPLVCLSVMIALGFRGDALVALLAVFASPTAVASSPMAQTMGGNARLAGEIVALTTAFSILTVFLFIAALSGLGLL